MRAALFEAEPDVLRFGVLERIVHCFLSDAVEMRCDRAVANPDGLLALEFTWLARQDGHPGEFLQRVHEAFGSSRDRQEHARVRGFG